MFLYLSIMNRIGKALRFAYPKRRYPYGQPAQIDNLQASTSKLKVTGHMWRECEIVQPPGDRQQVHRAVSLATSTQTRDMKQ